MKPLVIEGFNAKMIGDDDIADLHVVAVKEGDTFYYVSRWEPLPHELELLNRGGSVELWCIGAQPPVALTVAEHVEPIPELVITDEPDDDDPESESGE